MESNYSNGKRNNALKWLYFPFPANVLASRDSGWYSCGAVSQSGSVIARAEIDVAKEVDRPPPIIQLGPVNQTLPIRTSASLPCQASGDETISWLRDGVPLSTLVDRRYLVDSDNTLSIKSKHCWEGEGLYFEAVHSGSEIEKKVRNIAEKL